MTARTLDGSVSVPSLATLDMLFRLVALAILSLAACAGPTRGCDICTQSAIVYGTVTSDGGEPLGGASLRGFVGAEPCAVRAAVDEGGRTAADGLGRYRMQVQSGFAATRCVQVEAAGAGNPPVRAEAAAIRFEPTADASLPYDSVRVDIRLP